MAAQAQGHRLADKVAIVTGGGSGFGAAISTRFAQEGCRVLVCDINPEGAQKTVDNIHAATSGAQGERAKVQKMDVTVESDWALAVEMCSKTWNRLDCVVNNAGWSYKNKPTMDVTPDEYDRVFNINVKSLFWSVRAAVPALQRHGPEVGGSMINISSIGSSRPRPGLVWYNASKAAVTNASRALAAEYGSKGIRVNAICPLISGTGLFEAFAGVPYTPDNIKNFVSQVPLGRLTDPLDVANTALFLASDEGKFITGSAIDVDGGKGI